MASGDSPSNAAMEGGPMARRYFIYKVPPLGASCFLNNINVACGDGFPVQLGNGEGVWAAMARIYFLFTTGGHNSVRFIIIGGYFSNVATRILKLFLKSFSLRLILFHDNF